MAKQTKSIGGNVTTYRVRINVRGEVHECRVKCLNETNALLRASYNVSKKLGLERGGMMDIYARCIRGEYNHSITID